MKFLLEIIYYHKISELSANKIHVKAIGYVKAKSQSVIMHEIRR